MKLEIRTCRLDDIEAICRLNRQEMGYDYPAEEARRSLTRLLSSGRDKIWIAAVEGTVVGYAHACDYDVIYGPHMKNIMGIAVASAVQGQGIGRALLAAVEQWARQTGAREIRLTSGGSRTGAHAFYRHCGYGSEKQQINFRKPLKTK